MSNSELSSIEELKRRRDVTQLIEALSARKAEVRQAAEKALVELGAGEAAPPSIGALLGSEVSEALLNALLKLAYAGKLGKDATRPLVKMILGTGLPSREIKRRALLLKLDRDLAVNLLLAALEDKHSIVRFMAAETLGLLGDSRAVEALKHVLASDKELIVRRNAAAALGKLKDPRAAETLIAAVKTDEAEVLQEAAEAIKRLGGTVAEALIVASDEDDWRTQLRLAEALGRLGSPAVSRLSEFAVSGASPRVRREAVQSLGDLRHSQGTDPLIQALRDKSAEVRREAAKALGKLASRQALEPLVGTLKDKDTYVRIEAAEALGKLDDRRAVQALADALRDPFMVKASGHINDGWDQDYFFDSYPVRERAAEALERIGGPEAEKALAKYRVGSW